MKNRLEYRALTFLMVSLFAVIAMGQSAAPTNLAGDWRFAMDREDVGVNEGWFKKSLTDKIKIPGILQSQGYGDEITTQTPWVAALPRDMRWYLLPQYEPYTHPGNIKVPYLSQPPRHYLGVAWYQRDIEIPQGWQGKRVHLSMERPRWETRVWIDDKPVGSNNSLCAPHEYDLGILSPGKHQISVRCDTRMNIVPGYRPDGHSVSDALGSSWNGIAGHVELTATSPVWIDDVQVFPSINRWTARVKVNIGNLTGQSGSGTLKIGEFSEPVQWTAAGGEREVEVRLPQDAKMWDEFHPELQKMTVQLNGEGADDQRTVTYGIREIWTDGPNFILNGKVINLRGTHWGGDFPLTGYPATDVESWKKILQICKDHGLNHLRFHSWCPPDEAFTAADELGMYMAPECGMWNPFNPMDPMSKMLELETARIMKAYGNHPSFVMVSASNETSGNWSDVLNSWAYRWYREDQRHLYCTNTGRSSERDWGAQYASTPYRSTSGWFGRDYGSQLQNRIPDVGHEVGQWCAYPDFDIIKNLSGYLEPKNYEIFRDSAAKHGMLEKNKAFTFNSGKFQVACYKEEIEANLRTPGAAGFQLLDLHDYVGQGGALVGVLDPLWQPKGYITAEQFRRFCNTTVPLARVTNLTPKTSDEFAVPVEIAHFGPEPLTQAKPVWKIVDLAGKVAVQGQFEPKDIPIGKNIELGTINVDLSKLQAPMQYKLIVGLESTAFENDWNFWLYPANPPTEAPADILVTGDWDAAKAALAKGGKVLFTPPISSLDDTSPPLNNVPVFWNRLMNPGLQAMMGLLVHPEHPALALFPSQTWCDWEWTAAIRNGVPPTGGGRGRGGFGGGGFPQAAADAADAALVPPGSSPAAPRGGARGGRGGGQRGGGAAALAPATNPAGRRGGAGAGRGRGAGGGGAAPPPAYIRAINVEKAPKELEPIVSAIDDWNRNYKLAVVFEVKVGTGRLIVSAPDVQNDLDQRVVPRQLRVSLLNYMKSDKFQPPVSMTADQLSALWPGREGYVAPAARPQALPGDIIEDPTRQPPAQ